MEDGSAEPQDSRGGAKQSPSPRRGEGWGEGDSSRAQTNREVIQIVLKEERTNKLPLSHLSNNRRRRQPHEVNDRDVDGLLGARKPTDEGEEIGDNLPSC